MYKDVAHLVLNVDSFQRVLRCQGRYDEVPVPPVVPVSLLLLVLPFVLVFLVL